jgi:hypothetical protein
LLSLLVAATLTIMEMPVSPLAVALCAPMQVRLPCNHSLLDPSLLIAGAQLLPMLPTPLALLVDALTAQLENPQPMMVLSPMVTSSSAIALLVPITTMVLVQFAQSAPLRTC